MFSTMGNKQFRRLEDFWRYKAQVQCTCSNCQHVGTLDAYNLFRYFQLRRWNTQLEALGDHLRCKVCRRRSPAIKPSPSNPDPTDFWPREEADWKRMVARLRG